MSENHDCVAPRWVQTLSESTSPVIEASIVASPDQQPDALGAVLGPIVRVLSGPLLLLRMDASAALTAAAAAGEGCLVYFVHTDVQVLRAAYRSTIRTPYSSKILFFHGQPLDFFRNFPIHPAAVAVPGGDDLLAVWRELPAGAAVVVQQHFHQEDHWVDAGHFERIRGYDGGRVFRASGRFPASVAGLPSALFQSARVLLAELYFVKGGLCVESPFTPCEQVLGPVRQWARANQPAAVSGYGEWPWNAAPPPLPDTLPNGERWPLISIVTPSFNQGRYIEETILSVARQGYPRVEHIVMDGGSTDSTAAVMRRYRHHLAVAVSEKDNGQSHAINKGMAHASGDILTWLNSDDMLAPGALAAVAMGFHTSRADLVAGIVTLRSNGATVGHHMTCCEPGLLPLDDLLDLDGGWNAGQFFYQPEVMFSRELWERAGAKVREDLFYSMDYDLWVRMAEAQARIHVIGHPVAWFRLHEEQKTNAEQKFKAELRRYVDEFYQRTGRPRRPSKAHAQPKQQLRIAMLNDHGFRYGAGIAHKRLADALTLSGHTVLPFSLRAEPGYTSEPTTLSASEVALHISAANPDVVITGNLHSAGPDPWQLGILAEKYPVMAVLHDFWLLTGRCAYPRPCEKFVTGCDDTCPTAHEYPSLPPHKIAEAWRRKQQLLFAGNQLILLGNSAWTTAFARNAIRATAGRGKPSPVEQFRLNFPLHEFRVKDRVTCRLALGLPEQNFIVLLTGDLYDKRKNTQLALDALASLHLPDLTVVSLGQKRDGESFDLPDVRRLGHITDTDKLTSLYSAADLFVGPSQEETFGQVFIEAIACGTPAIGFRASGMQEAVVHGLTGLLAEDCSEASLASSIYYLYTHPELRRDMARWGRIYVENEWSPQASYFHLFQAWRRLGLLEKLQLPPKISFLPQQPETPECRTIHPEAGVTMDSTSLGSEEGPYPEYSLPKFRWAYGPVSECNLHSENDGPHSLILRYRNLHGGQTMHLHLNGAPLGDFTLPETGIGSGRLLCVKADIRRGPNELRLRFSRWDDPAVSGRPLAVLFTEFSLFPDVSSAHSPRL